MFDWIFDHLLRPFGAMFDPAERLSVWYQLTALLAAVGFYLAVVARGTPGGAAGLMRWLFPRDVLRHPSAMADYVFFVANRLMRALVYGQIFLLTPVFTYFWFTTFTETFGPPDWTTQSSLFWTVVTTLVMALVLDAALWFVHWLFHVVPELWEFHKVHHSAEVLTPLTAARMHPVEEIVDSLVASAVLGLSYTVMVFLLGPATIELTLFEINVVILGFYLAAFNLRHSHVFLRYPHWLQHVFVSPAQHQVHHSVRPEHWDRNMGFIFSFWDWAAGTLVSPRRHETLTFGLGTREDGTWHGVGTLYLRPFGGAWRRLRARARRLRRRPAGTPVAPGE